MIHRGIISLALALMTCFLALSHFDSQFFLIHFYESLIYIVIVLMFFPHPDRGIDCLFCLPYQRNRFWQSSAMEWI